MKKILPILLFFILILGGIKFIYSLNKKTNSNNNFNKINKNTMLKKITPNIMVADVNATADYYKNNLDFQIVMGVDENKEVKMGDSVLKSTLTWAMLKKDEVEIMLQRNDSFIEELPNFKEAKMGGTFTLYISMQDTKGFYDKIKGKVEIVKDMHKTFYGADEFVVKDLNGYIIYFAEAQNE